jgi:hypothetical protein
MYGQTVKMHPPTGFGQSSLFRPHRLASQLTIEPIADGYANARCGHSGRSNWQHERPHRVATGDQPPIRERLCSGPRIGLIRNPGPLQPKVRRLVFPIRSCLASYHGVTPYCVNPIQMSFFLLFTNVTRLGSDGGRARSPRAYCSARPTTTVRGSKP